MVASVPTQHLQAGARVVSGAEMAEGTADGRPDVRGGDFQSGCRSAWWEGVQSWPHPPGPDLVGLGWGPRDEFSGPNQAPTEGHHSFLRVLCCVAQLREALVLQEDHWACHPQS